MYLVGPATQLNAVPPHSAARCGCPWSLTGMRVEMVPSVCPGVMYSVRVVSPSCELHAVGRHDVTLRHRLPIRVGCRALEQIPVVRRQDDAGAELVLQVLC